MTMTSGLGGKYVQAVCSGQGLAGVAAAIAYCINLAAAGNPLTAGVSFFVTAAVFAALTFASHCAVTSSKFYKANSKQHSDQEDTDALIENEIVHDEQSEEDKDEEEENAVFQENISRLAIIKRCYPEIYSIFGTLLVTLSVFPGLCVAIQSSSDDDFTKKWFTPVLTMLLYNIGDTMGRLATAMVSISPDSKRTIMALTTSRLVFWIIFPLCNINRIGDGIPTLITQDWLYSLIMFIFR